MLRRNKNLWCEKEKKIGDNEHVRELQEETHRAIVILSTRKTPPFSASLFLAATGYFIIFL